MTWIEGRARSLGKALRTLERVFARVGAVLLLALPFLTVCVLAGAAKTRVIVFLPALVAGHFLWVFTTVWLGTRFAAEAQSVVDFFAERLFESTLDLHWAGGRVSVAHAAKGCPTLRLARLFPAEP